MMVKFVQKFRRVARGSEYERRPLIKEFKREMNRTIYLWSQNSSPPLLNNSIKGQLIWIEIREKVEEKRRC